MRLIPTLLLLVAALPRPAAAQEASSPEVTRFVARLKAVTAGRDRAAMAGLFHYPASVWTGRCSVWILAPADLLARYDAIFSPSLRRSIARVTRDSIVAPLDGGVMLDDGRIWLGETGPRNALRIITVNPPVSGDEAADLPGCTQTLPPRISTGIAGSYVDRRGREAGCSLDVADRPRGRMRFVLDCNRGAPSYNMGHVEGTAAVRNGVAVSEERQGSEACKLRFVFRAGGWAEVTQDGGCGFGFDVYANGLYRRIRAASPRG